MAKRLLALFLVAIVFVSTANTAFAALESTAFEPLIIADMESFASSTIAAQSERRAFVAAALYSEFLLHNAINDIEYDSPAAGHDCVIARDGDLISIGYYQDENTTLSLVYNTSLKKMGAFETNVSPSLLTSFYDEVGYTSIQTIPFTDWSEILLELLDVLANQLK